MIVISVDPGLTGGVAWIDDHGLCGVADIPTVDIGGGGLVKRRVDGRGLILLLRHFCRPGEPVLTVCESVRALSKGNAIQTQGSLMRTLGAIEAALDIMRVPPELIEPQTWKRFYKLGKDKKQSLQVARTLFPTLAAELNLVRHHNRAEALLIANYGLRKLAAA